MDYEDKMRVTRQLARDIAKDRKDPLPNMGNDDGRFIDERIAFEAYSPEEMRILNEYRKKEDEAVMKARAENDEEKNLENKLKMKYEQTRNQSAGNKSTQWYSKNKKR